MDGVEGYMSVPEAAERWGRDATVLRQFLRRGMIPGAERNGPLGTWRIPAYDSPPVMLPRRDKLAEDERREIARRGHAGANRSKLARAYGVQRLHVYRMMEKYPPEDADGDARG